MPRSVTGKSGYNWIRRKIWYRKGTKIVLGADDRFDENSFSDPLKIVPKVTELSGISNEFTIDCQANSLTVLRIPCEK